MSIVISLYNEVDNYFQQINSPSIFVFFVY